MTERERHLLALEANRHLILAQLMEEPALARGHDEIAQAIYAALLEGGESGTCRRSEIGSHSGRPPTPQTYRPGWRRRAVRPGRR